ncbi:MAG: response regulator [Nitratireductor sp.]|nr:response regulator [Nitratireductor sp.]
MAYRFFRTKGSGFNSIPVRFSLAATLFTICVSGTLQLAQGAAIDQWFYLATLASAALGGLIFYGMGWVLTRPLHKLEQIVKTVAGGGLAETASLQCSCEVGALGDNINLMINRLRERESRLSVSHDSEHKLRLQLLDAIDALEDQFLLFSPDGALVLANSAFRKAMRGLKVEIEPGISFTEMINKIALEGNVASTAEERNAWIARQHQLRSQALSADHPIEVERADGHTMRISVYRTANGNIVDVRTDTSAEKRRQRELETALEKAEAGDKAKSEFLANMSHEIRTPMNGVIGMAELLANTELDQKQRVFTDVIVRSGTALMGVINDILDFSKISAGQIVLDNAAFDPRTVVNDVAQLLAAKLAEKDMELIVRTSPLVPAQVDGDKGRFRQILNNLVGNAVKFTEFGHVLIELNPISDGSGIKVTVEDTGCGIPDDQYETIFEHFHQIDNSSTRRFDGTGLGLSISRRLARLMGGDITVSSVVGEGSTFTFTAPLVHVGESATPVVTQLRNGDEPVRILVIDDNAINRNIYEELLANWGFEAASAADAATGLAVMDQAAELAVPVDLVILDYAMPGMNGLEAARLIRETEALKDTPILLLTSMDFATSGDLVKARLVDVWLNKPCHEQVLRQEVFRLLALDPATPGIDEKPVETLPPTSPEKPNAAMTLDILVAEDNPVNQIVIREILETTSFSFEIIDNGEMAVERWQAVSPRLILMDVSMPVLNGYEATRRIRSIEADTGNHVPILAVTAHAATEDEERALACGMDDFVRKPLFPDHILNKINAMIGGVESRNAA